MESTQIRRGNPADALDFAELALLTGPELLPALFGSESKFRKVMRESFPRSRNCFSHEHSHFLEADGRTAVMALAFTRAQMRKEQLRTLLSLMRHLKTAFFRQIVHLRKASTIQVQIEEGDSYLAHVATYPEFRSRGLGARLLEAVEQEARAAGSRRVVLDAETDNRRAIDLYERLAYRVESKSPVLRIGRHHFEFYKMVRDLA